MLQSFASSTVPRIIRWVTLGHSIPINWSNRVDVFNYFHETVNFSYGVIMASRQSAKKWDVNTWAQERGREMVGAIIEEFFLCVNVICDLCRSTGPLVEQELCKLQIICVNLHKYFPPKHKKIAIVQIRFAISVFWYAPATDRIKWERARSGIFLVRAKIVLVRSSCERENYLENIKSLSN
jgi:hypothetical protein